MHSARITKRLFWMAELSLLGGVIAASVWLSRPEEWHPLDLVIVLLALASLGEWFTVRTHGGVLSASLGTMVLAMGLLGPAPAAACGITAMVMHSAKGRRPAAQWLNNLTTYALAPFAGGLIVRALASEVHGMHSQSTSQTIMFGLTVLLALIVLLVLNFVLFALDVRIEEGRSLRVLVRELFLPLLPGELAVGVIATLLVLAYRGVGLPVLFASIAVLAIFRHLTVALLRSEDRAEQLEARSRQLVGLQLGVLRTLVRALGMREKTTGRHAAAVARYARALAKEAGCDERERDEIHAAGLLHEIGKFTWPDRILHAEVIQQEDLAIIKNHPQEGAILVGALDGYGPVADAILYHHERVDGCGYPAGLIGNEIPLASRILAICCTFHTMMSGQGYRSTMSSEEAQKELRVAARSGQLDSALVEQFVELLDREGESLAQETDFETELEFERRVDEMAAPPSLETSARPRRTSRNSPGTRS